MPVHAQTDRGVWRGVEVMSAPTAKQTAPVHTIHFQSSQAAHSRRIAGAWGGGLGAGARAKAVVHCSKGL